VVSGQGFIQYLSNVSLQAWVEQQWVPLLGYTPEILHLTKGWLGFICKSPEDLSTLLESRWVMGGNNLMLKRWRVAFDPTTSISDAPSVGAFTGLTHPPLERGSTHGDRESLGSFISVDSHNLTPRLERL
jgi:hypothetical protein